jgi:hypothetical protein
MELKFIKNLKDTNINNLHILRTYAFGNKEIKIYNEKKIYNINDLILNIDNSNNIFEILKCKSNNITGAFNIINWEKISLIDEIEKMQLGDTNDIENTLKILLDITPSLSESFKLSNILVEDFNNISNINLVSGIFKIGSISI